MEELLIKAGGAALSGLAYAFTNYSYKQRTESFSFKKALPIIGTSAIVGGIAAYQGIEVGIIESSAISTLVASVIENVVKAIYRRIPTNKETSEVL